MVEINLDLRAVSIMAPLQGSRHGKTETEGLLRRFARFVLTFCLSMSFVGCGDSTHRCRRRRHPQAEGVLQDTGEITDLQ